jgi:hypothetical protein
MLKKMGGLSSLYNNSGGQKPIYPRISDIEASLSGAEQRIGDPSFSSFGGTSDGGFSSPMAGVYSQSTGGELPPIQQAIQQGPLQIPSTLINPVRPGVDTSQLGSPRTGGMGSAINFGQLSSLFGGAGDPRLGAPVIPGNYFQTIMRGGAANGGMMGRQQYGLGSFVKKAVKGVTGAVKSIAKSDLGKAALLIGGGMYAGGLGPFAAAGRFGSIPGAGFASGIPSLIKGGVKALGLGVPAGGKPTLGQFGKVFALGSLGGAALEALTASGADEEELENIRDPETLRAYLRRGYKQLNPGAESEQIEEFVTANTTEYAANGGRIGYADGTSFQRKALEKKGYSDMMQNMTPKEISQLYDSVMGTFSRRFQAYGGRIGYNEGTDFQKWLEGKQKFEQGQNFEQLYREYLEDKRRQKVAEQKTMAANGGRIGYAFGNPEQNAINASGIMNLPLNQNPAGVTELDLRDSGGFIPPVGVKEKADDIPAMLSNNEFVFTAESVRNMGNGDVNKGAQRMYDMMKYLEKGGRV